MPADRLAARSTALDGWGRGGGWVLSIGRRDGGGGGGGGAFNGGGGGGGGG